MKKKLISFVYNIFTSGIEDISTSVKYKLILLNTVLLVAAMVMTSTFLYRLTQPFNPMLIFIDASTSIAFWGSFFVLRVNKSIQNIIVFSSIAIIAFMLTFLFVEKNNSLAIVWAYMIPLYVIFINGYKRGFLLCILFYACIAFHMVVHAPLWLESGWDRQSAIRFATTSATLTLVLAGCEYIFTQFQQSLYLLSNTDALTNINNRRHLDFLLTKVVETKKRYDFYLSLVIIDIDNFKSINDTFGHPIGDVVLKKIAHLLTEKLRITDEVGRWGGEEFCLILPQTNQDDAFIILERLRLAITQYDFGINRTVTCSFGLCTVKTNTFTKEQLVSSADKALYEAKKTGKNKICCTQLLE